MSRGEDELLAVARKGYWREADARVVVRAWRRSGKPAVRFAVENGLDPARLSRWAARLDGRANPGVRFHPVRLIPPVGRGVAGEAIEVVLVDGRRVRVPAGFAAEDLERVLGVLEGRGRC